MKCPQNFSCILLYLEFRNELLATLSYANSRNLRANSIGSGIDYGKCMYLAIKLDSGKDVLLLRRGALSLPLRLAWRIEASG